MLVLDDAESIFVPLAVKGFDNTTKRRLRIPREIIDQHSSLQRGDSLALAGEQRAFLEPFFSVREFGGFCEVYLVPLKRSGVIHGVLIAAREEQEDNDASFEYPSIPDDCGEFLYSCFTSKLINLSLPPFYGDRREGVNALDPIVKRHREAGRSLFLCTINAGLLLDSLVPSSNTIDLFKYREIVRRILYSIALGTGIYLESSENTVVIGFAGSAITDCNFLSHHLHATISDFFPDTSLPASIIEECEYLNNDEIPASSASLFN